MNDVVPSAPPTIASGALRRLFTLASSLGVEPRALAAQVKLDYALVDDPDARVPLSTLHAAWEALLARVPRSDLPLVGAEAYEPSDYGLVGFVVMNSPTIGEALGHAIRFLGLWTDDPALRLYEDGTLTVVYRSVKEDRPGLRCATEATFAEVLHAARMLSRPEFAPREVRFAHPAPPDTSAHEAYFRCKVIFGAEDTAMALRPEELALALPKADAALGAFLRKQATEALERRGGPHDVMERMRALLAEELQTGVPALDSLAKRMGTSERTLRRRLDESGTSFREVLDETRAELARKYVKDRRLPLAEVAFLLGFSDPSAFHRAFKRWMGTTPKAWRDRS